MSYFLSIRWPEESRQVNPAVCNCGYKYANYRHATERAECQLVALRIEVNFTASICAGTLAPATLSIGIYCGTPPVTAVLLHVGNRHGARSLRQ